MGRNRVIINRLCAICSSKTTYIDKRDGSSVWHLGYNKETLCHRCWNREIGHKRRIKFLGIRIHIPWLRRKYRCSLCSKKKKMTAFHHLFYLRICPWFGIQEVCWDCHTKAHKKSTPY